MKVLFITSSRLGDAVLSTGLADHIIRTYPGARITVACGGLAASLFEGMPGLDRVIIIRKQSFNRHWLKLWTSVVSSRWDMVVDLRDSIVSRAVFARKRFIFSRHIDKRLHKVEQNAAVMGVSPPPAPVVWVSPAQATRAQQLVPDGSPVLAVGPAANWIGKTWPAERFIAVVAAMTAPGGMMPGARVAVFAAPGEEAAARQVLASVPEACRIDMIARTDPGTAAACLKRCAFYIGNDSGLMHGAAAAGVQTVGLFGPSWPHLYRPWGKKASYVATPEDFKALTDFPGYDSKMLGRSLMDSLSVEAVLAHLESLRMSV
jgi:lipopolysaccharide export system permease protein